MDEESRQCCNSHASMRCLACTGSSLAISGIPEMQTWTEFKPLWQQRVYEVSVELGHTTNNCAEYLALIYGLRTALALDYDHVHARGDSMLVVQQMLGNWGVQAEGLSVLHREATLLSNLFQQFAEEWVPRECNQQADVLARSGIGKCVTSFQSEF